MRANNSVHPRPHDEAPVRLAPGGEFDLIRRFLAGKPQDEREDVRVGPGDDCAVVAGDGIALSSDMSVEDVHFRRDWLAPEEIGWRAAAAALSDLAAVAARPIGILVSLAAPPDDAGDYVVRVMAGCREAVQSCGGALLGGDLTRSPGPLVVDVTVVGEAPRPVLRSGARPGQELWVTGELGGSAACVEALLQGRTPDAAARERFARPRPRVAEAQWLQARGIPTAMVDLSDGLAGDAAHLAAASGVAMLLVPELIPIHPAARERSRIRSLRRALGGGEDYELCFAAAVGAVGPYHTAFERAFGVRLSCVGRAGGGDGVWFVDAEGHRRPTGVAGWQHFGGGRP
ncbi:MAG TPA: thiamine-phosphate kinase [Longimicrobium sp.]|nr:thiamine-phosphate kinase [Longimicrobium sp.]